MKFRNPFDIPPIRPAPLPGTTDPTGELSADQPDALLDSERPPPVPEGEPLRVQFTGRTSEYARLWFVNLLLTVCTLGIYSAWAKVAAREYFASRTLVGGIPFAYHGRPLPILKGRLIAVAIVALGWALAKALPVLQPLLVALVILAAPWFLLQTFTFDARNYSHRGLHFGFAAPYRAAVVAILPLLAWPLSEVAFRIVDLNSASPASFMAEMLVPLLIFAFLWPRTIAAVTRLRFEGTHYGTVRFTLDATVADFYRLYFRGLGPVFGVLLFTSAVLTAFTSRLADPDVVALAQVAVYAAATAIALGFARGRRFNLGLHRLTGDERIRFRSTLNPGALGNLYLRNALWIIATAGLAAPWRRILVARMRAQHVTVYVAGGFNDIRADGGHAPGAFGESLAESLNLDLSL